MPCYRQIAVHALTGRRAWWGWRLSRGRRGSCKLQLHSLMRILWHFYKFKLNSPLPTEHLQQQRQINTDHPSWRPCSRSSTKPSKIPADTCAHSFIHPSIHPSIHLSIQKTTKRQQHMHPQRGRLGMVGDGEIGGSWGETAGQSLSLKFASIFYISVLPAVSNIRHKNLPARLMQ